ncbi:MAG: phytoene desaturase family protein [Sediminispirochaetaceae bacterium]
MTRETCDVLVVGGGMAGLTAAAYLSRGGYKVILTEKNGVCGGLVNSFTRDGFLFDAGVRALEDAGIILPMLKDLDIDLEFVRSPVTVGIEGEILHIESEESVQDYRELLRKLYPRSGNDIDRIIRLIRRIMKNMDVLYGIENPVFKDLKHDREYLFRTLLPWLLKFLFTVRKINRMDYPIEPFLEKITADASLRDIISQHFFKNTPTFFAMSYFSLYLDYLYPKGGTGALPGALEKKIAEFGGRIDTGTEIREVIPRESTAKDVHGREYAYGTLIWAADLKTLFRITRTDGLPADTVRRIECEGEKLLSRRGGDSVFTLFLTVDEAPESFRQIANGHFFYTPSKKGLGDLHRQRLREILGNWSRISKEEVLEWLDAFCRLNTYEISIPALKDPSAAPPGKTGLIVSLLFEYDLMKKIEASGWYEVFKGEIETRMVEVLSGSVFPMLKDKVISRFSYTPLSIERRIGSSEGAITGWSFEEPVPVVHRIQHGARSVRTPIPGVLQAGQWAYSPAGVPMSILTGKLAADRIMKGKNRASAPISARRSPSS